jgi:hypothetical protein
MSDLREGGGTICSMSVLTTLMEWALVLVERGMTSKSDTLVACCKRLLPEGIITRLCLPGHILYIYNSGRGPSITS